MERTDVNPWEWSKAFGFSQAVAVDDPSRVVFVSGQTAIDAEGRPPTTTDMAEQVRTAMAALATVLEQAGMTTADIVKLAVYTTDVDELLQSGGMAMVSTAPNLPATTLIGVSRLAFAELKVEIEAIAAR